MYVNKKKNKQIIKQFNIVIIFTKENKGIIFRLRLMILYNFCFIFF